MEGIIKRHQQTPLVLNKITQGHLAEKGWEPLHLITSNQPLRIFMSNMCRPRSIPRNFLWGRSTNCGDLILMNTPGILMVKQPVCKIWKELNIGNRFHFLQSALQQTDSLTKLEFFSRLSILLSAVCAPS